MFYKYDKVRIRPDLAVGAKYHGNTITPSMAKYKGQVTEVFCETFWKGDIVYMLEADDLRHWWPEETLQAIKV